MRHDLVDKQAERRRAVAIGQIAIGETREEIVAAAFAHEFLDLGAHLRRRARHDEALASRARRVLGRDHRHEAPPELDKALVPALIAERGALPGAGLARLE